VSLQDLALIASIGTPILTGVACFIASNAGMRAGLHHMQTQINQVREDAARAHGRIDEVQLRMRF